jgi:hypothetical protein
VARTGPAGRTGSSGGVPTVPAATSLRDVLAELVWRGASAADVIESDGSVVGRLTLASILARGRQAT